MLGLFGSRITGRGVEVEERVVRVAGPDPVVQRLTLGFALRREVVRAVEGRERRAEDLQATRMGAIDDLLVRRDQIVRARGRLLARATDVVDAFQEDQMRDARLGGGIVGAGMPLNLSTRFDFSTIDESLSRVAICAAPMTSGDVPNVLLTATRTFEPPTLVCTI